MFPFDFERYEADLDSKRLSENKLLRGNFTTPRKVV